VYRLSFVKTTERKGARVSASRSIESIGDMPSFLGLRPCNCWVDVDQDIDCITSGRTAL